MVFNNVYFLFAFLPLSLLVYYLVPKKFRSIPSVLISLIFYAWGNPAYLLILVGSIVINYATGLEIGTFLERKLPKAAKITLIIGIVLNLLLLSFYKYTGFLLDNLSALFRVEIGFSQPALPLGISFFTFSAISYIVDVYREKCSPQKNLLLMAEYIAFFPKVLSGPIVQYTDMEKQLRRHSPSLSDAGAGLRLFIVGLGKKVMLSNILSVLYQAITGLSAMSVLTAWLGVLAYGLELYFDFSGYSDMAIGLSRMMGFRFADNFDYPYASGSVTEFWRRWHISLGAWFRDYIYIPLGGNRCSTLLQTRNLLVVWLITGLWHGSAWTFIVWGLYHCAFILLERFVLRKRQEIIPKPLRAIVICVVVFFGWVLFFSPTMGDALSYYSQMFGSAHLGLIDATARYYFSNYWIILLFGIIGCFPLAKRLHAIFAYQENQAFTIVSVVFYVLLFLLCVAYMVTSTYNSFLYFQF